MHLIIWFDLVPPCKRCSFFFFFLISVSNDCTLNYLRKRFYLKIWRCLLGFLGIVYYIWEKADISTDISKDISTGLDFEVNRPFKFHVDPPGATEDDDYWTKKQMQLYSLWVQACDSEYHLNLFFLFCSQLHSNKTNTWRTYMRH